MTFVSDVICYFKWRRSLLELKVITWQRCNTTNLSLCFPLVNNVAWWSLHSEFDNICAKNTTCDDLVISAPKLITTSAQNGYTHKQLGLIPPESESRLSGNHTGDVYQWAWVIFKACSVADTMESLLINSTSTTVGFMCSCYLRLRNFRR